MSNAEIFAEEVSHALRKGLGEFIGPEGEEVELHEAVANREFVTVKLDNGQTYTLTVTEVFP